MGENGGLGMQDPMGYGCDGCEFCRLSNEFEVECHASKIRVIALSCLSRIQTKKVSPRTFIRIMRKLFGRKMEGIPYLYNKYRDSMFVDPRDFLKVVLEPIREGVGYICLR